MRCKNCNYSLWNIKSRTCPECGAAFKPGEFEFVINSVRYSCPHCGQNYYGTGEKGHLVPSEFDCVSCSQHITMDEMVLLPADGVQDQQTEVAYMPWLERGHRDGIVKAWLKSTWMAMTAPQKLIECVPPEKGYFTATLFAVLSQIVVMSLAVVPLVLFVAIIAAFSGGRGGPPSLYGPFVGLVTGGVFMVVALVISLICLGISGLVAHGLLKVTGPTQYGIGRTWQALCYSSSANIVSAVPCIGGYFGWIWWAVSAVLMVKQGQRVSGVRASFAVLAPPLLFIGTIIGLYVALVIWAVSVGSARTTTTIGAGPAPGPWNTYTPTRALDERVQVLALGFVNPARDGSPVPRHVGQILAAGQVEPTDFVVPGSGSALGRPGAGAVIGSRQLLDFVVVTDAQKDAAVREAVLAFAPDSTAYRIGDMVFTHLGVKNTVYNNQEVAPKIWLVVAWPESWPPHDAPRTVYVGTASGEVLPLPRTRFDAELSEQNKTRASVGLAPIPYPGDVRSPGGSTPSSSSTPDHGEPDDGLDPGDGTDSGGGAGP